ncbi:hypothetical protein [Wenxinia saemankumensis]|uniref:HD domain-containing protein n=1 Tax=Wenxinia saemankumensis TaxID=1447782 RepID=A0A1M6EZ61_9RHOB|nr:hypothetical protein [Wenxinia saemankumensis]SHI90710.1 hypothetical protein SAMN05444417_2260 [Wenxinia saemankumensis]
MTPNLDALWRAGRVRRWHMNADLSWTSDFTDGHAGRVARLVRALDPECRAELLAAALAHDDGEYVAGDLARPAKDALDEDAAGALERLEADARGALWGVDPVALLTAEERALLRLCDLLDAWMWAKAHLPPHVLDSGAWRADRDRIAALAGELGLVAVGSVIGPPITIRRQERDTTEADGEGTACPGTGPTEAP